MELTNLYNSQHQTSPARRSVDGGFRACPDVAEWSGMVMINRLILAAALLAAAVPAAGQAKDEAVGRVTAFACESLPSPLNIEVETSDGSPQADRLRRVLVRSLLARQAVVSPGAPLRLSLYVESVRAPEIRKGRDLDKVGSGNDVDDPIRIRIDIWSNRRNSVIGGLRDQVLTAVDELRIEITLDSRTNGRCVWQGKAVFKLGGRDEIATAETIIPLLVERLGRSARAEPFDLD